jgi:hypothetical protein
MIVCKNILPVRDDSVGREKKAEGAICGPRLKFVPEAIFLRRKIVNR